jgi:hypothetical protein
MALLRGENYFLAKDQMYQKLIISADLKNVR